MRVALLGTGAIPLSAAPEHAAAAEYHIFRVATHLARLGIECVVIDVVDSSGSRRLEGGAIEWVEVGFPPLPTVSLLARRRRSFAFAVAVMPHIQRILRERGPIVFHNHSQWTGMTLLLLRQLNGGRPRFVHTTHDPYVISSKRRDRVAHIMEVLALRHADRVIVPSASVGRQIAMRLGMEPWRFVPISHGLDLEMIDNFRRKQMVSKSEVPLILHVGRVEPRKNQMALVKAASVVKKARPEARFVLAGPVGDRSYFAGLADYVEREGLSSSVNLTGEVGWGELYRLFAKAWIFAFPSFAEIGAQALREAMAFNLPILAAPIPFVLDLAGLDQSAFLLCDADKPQELADRILHLVDNPTARHEMGHRARSIADRTFDMAHVARQLLGLYQCLGS